MSRKLILLFAATAVLAGCGGAGDGDGVAAAPPGPPVTAPAPPPPPPAPPPPSGVVPGSASSSVEAFFAYLLTLTGMSDQSSEPLDVSSVTPPTTETAEPSTLP